ncbi:hypothetical protein M9Y10_013796 [Tritrichomonas musculus]|uniref:Uncharacterized protein n=1 Tax=Tritrichomonas musculus TaxID=1915356 RepID=A0ABR2L117_9EUKA
MEQQSKVIDSTISLSNISDLELLKQLIKELIRDDEIAALRKLLRVNKNCMKFKTKDLNDELYKDGYRFVKRNGVMTYITSKQKPKYGESIEKCQSVLNKINNN